MLKKSVLYILLIVLCTNIALSYPICGNGVLEENETMDSCCLDAGCPQNFHCTLNICVEDVRNEIEELFIFVPIVVLVFACIWILFALDILRRYLHLKKLKKQPDYYQKIQKIRSFILEEEDKGVRRDHLLIVLKDEGYDPILVDDIAQRLRKESKLLDKFQIKK